MDSAIMVMEQDKERQNVQGMILNMSTVSTQTPNQFQLPISTTGSLGVFQPTGVEVQQQSFSFDFDNQIFDDLITTPFSTDFDDFINSPFLSNPNPEPSLPSALGHFHSCIQGHNHLPWPRKGLLEIQKCERRCHFCGQELKTAAALRKHVYDHKRKDEFDIEIIPGKSGRQRRALIPENRLGLLDHPLLLRHERHIVGDTDDSFAGIFKSPPKSLNEAVILARNLHHENAGLKEEIKALKSEISRLERVEKNREAQRRFREKLKNKQSSNNAIDGNGATASEVVETDNIPQGSFHVPNESLDESISLPWGGISTCHVVAGGLQYRRSHKKREPKKFSLLAAFSSMRISARPR
ncbi:hypothetical protein F5Y09DRAFT_163401 [Xylaria sp. FL1042]|nr:hypothetical protein F5Y09DRAFT_163401 [Xylaria sp. FL1042]